MSIYAALKGRFPEDSPHASSTQATITLVPNGESDKNDPLLGITYKCDFRAEEESGAASMTDLFTRTADTSSFLAQQRAKTDAFADIAAPHEKKPHLPQGVTQADLIDQNNDVVAFASTLPLHAVERQIKQAKQFIRSSEPYARGLPSVPRSLWRSSRDELRRMAKERGMKRYSSMKRNDLMYAIHHHDHADLPETHVHPGWFHFGTLLVLPRTDDVFGAVLERLIDATQAGFLSVGNSIGFGTGFSFFDERDLSAEAKTVIAREHDQYCEDMEALRPVAETVRQKHGYRSITRPRRDEDGVTRYLLDGPTTWLPSGRLSHPFGWYSAQELLDEKYIQDAEVKADEREAREKEMA